MIAESQPGCRSHHARGMQHRMLPTRPDRRWMCQHCGDPEPMERRLERDYREAYRAVSHALQPLDRPARQQILAQLGQQFDSEDAPQNGGTTL